MLHVVKCYFFTIIQQETNVKRLELKLKMVSKKLSCGGGYIMRFRLIERLYVRERYFLVLIAIPAD